MGLTTAACCAQIRRLCSLLDVLWLCHVPQPWSKRFEQLHEFVQQVEQQHALSAPTAAASDTEAAASAPPVADGSSSSGSMLNILGIENGSTLRLQFSRLQHLHLSAYQIDTELLFTTQPFSNFSSSTGSSGFDKPAAFSTPAYVHRGTSGVSGMSGSSSGAAAGTASTLGRVSYVQPTARAVLVLMGPQDQPVDAATAPHASTSTGTADTESVATAAAAAAESVAAAAAAPGSIMAASELMQHNVLCRPVHTGVSEARDRTGVAGVAVAGIAGSNSPAHVHGLWGCDVDLASVLPPGLRHESVVLEVSGAGLSRTVAR